MSGTREDRRVLTCFGSDTAQPVQSWDVLGSLWLEGALVRVAALAGGLAHTMLTQEHMKVHACPDTTVPSVRSVRRRASSALVSPTPSVLAALAFAALASFPLFDPRVKPLDCRIRQGKKQSQ